MEKFMKPEIICPDCSSSNLEISEGVKSNQYTVLCPQCGSLFLVKSKTKPDK
jgi:DNA-directed RNA polymerase subunit RPC12/RpoP